MIRFDWKQTGEGQFPPKPKQTKDFWKNVDPGMTPLEVQAWYSTAFKIYACKIRGCDNRVPKNLYYIGAHEWMSETGCVYPEEQVEAWDSYEDDSLYKESDDPYIEGTIKVDGGNYHSNLTANRKGILCAAGYLCLLFKDREPDVSTEEVLSIISKVIEYLEDEKE
jgi:hypothetical protein